METEEAQSRNIHYSGPTPSLFSLLSRLFSLQLPWAKADDLKARNFGASQFVCMDVQYPYP